MNKSSKQVKLSVRTEGTSKMNPDQGIVSAVKPVLTRINSLSNEQKIVTINEIKKILHQLSPMKSEPVDCVLWVPNDLVQGNYYNPNSVAPPEMKLLEHSIEQDGYTQPIVTYSENHTTHVIVDGFHRNRVGKESVTIRKRVMDHLPIVIINDNRTDKGDRIAATIRHNRARGKHQVEAMSDIVIELKRRNWNDDKIGRELGMDPDEVLRLSQITGLAEIFSDKEFSMSWDIDTDIEDSGDELTEDDI